MEDPMTVKDLIIKLISDFDRDAIVKIEAEYDPDAGEITGYASVYVVNPDGTFKDIITTDEKYKRFV